MAKRSCCIALLSLSITCLFLLILVFYRRAFVIFIGQMVAAILLAMALQTYAPRLLGKAFWFTLVLFCVLIIFLTVAKEDTVSLQPTFHPMSLGPNAPDYGAPLGVGADLPVNFKLSKN